MHLKPELTTSKQDLYKIVMCVRQWVLRPFHNERDTKKQGE